MGLLRSMVLSVGLLAGVAATAHAQSVSTLPPDNGSPTQTARSPVTGSTQSFFPKPGGSQVITQENYQPQASSNSNSAVQPNSKNWAGPKPN
jgi:hypothetical protein